METFLNGGNGIENGLEFLWNWCVLFFGLFFGVPLVLFKGGIEMLTFQKRIEDGSTSFPSFENIPLKSGSKVFEVLLETFKRRRPAKAWLSIILPQSAYLLILNAA